MPMNPTDADLPTTAQRRRSTHHSPTTVQPHHSPPMLTNPATYRHWPTHTTTTTTGETERWSAWVWGDRWLGTAGSGRRRWMRELERVMVREESDCEFWERLGMAGSGRRRWMRELERGEWLREDESLREFGGRMRASDGVIEREKGTEWEREWNNIFIFNSHDQCTSIYRCAL